MRRFIEAESRASDSLEGLDLGQPPLLPEVEVIQFFTPTEEDINSLRKLNKAGRALLTLSVAIAASAGLSAAGKENKREFAIAGALVCIGLAVLHFDLGDLAINHIEAIIEE